MQHQTKKTLTSRTAVEKMVSEIRFWAAQTGHGALEFSCRIEVHDGLVKQIDLTKPAETKRFRSD